MEGKMIMCERPLTTPNKMRVDDLRVLLSLPIGSEITYTGFETEQAVNNATILAQNCFSKRDLPRHQRVSYRRITLEDNSLAVVMRIVEKE